MRLFRAGRGQGGGQARQAGARRSEARQSAGGGTEEEVSGGAVAGEEGGEVMAAYAIERTSLTGVSASLSSAPRWMPEPDNSRKCRPSGRRCGHRAIGSALEGRPSGFPPPAGTRISAPTVLSLNTIVSSDPQLPAHIRVVVVQIGATRSPSIDTRLRNPGVKNAMCLLDGDQNAASAPSVPRRGRALLVSSECNHSCDVLPVVSG